jgi:uncharacterized protein (TIGR03067 family)
MSALSWVLLVLLTIPPDNKTTQPKLEGDLAKLQGYWVGKIEGQKVGMNMEITGTKIAMTLILQEDPDHPLLVNGTMKIDESKKPKEWDFLGGVGPQGQKLPDALSIYELNGDVLKIYSAPPGKPRPTEIKPDNPAMPQTVFFTRTKKPSDKK